MNRASIALCLVSIAGAGAAAAAEPLKLERGDRICIVGNALADRMQHSGYFESLIHLRHPDYNVVVRNLGFAGDDLTIQMRSEGFGSMEDWLRRSRADVVLAFFGYNESFAGPAGIDRFRADLAAFIDRVRGVDFGGKGPARLALFSPVAAERHPDPNYPRPESLNRNLSLYAEAMSEVAEARGITYVDLYSESARLYESASRPLTVNAVHLNDAGYRALAPGTFEGLLGERPPAMEGERFASILAAVREKNAAWFGRYRTVDGYNGFL
jgi:lysophospholipase L1-like esterase